MKKAIIYFVIFYTGVLGAQSNNLSFHEINQFLQTMETKGLIPLSSYGSFLTLNEMRTLLNGIDTTKLTLVEKEKLHYLILKELSFDKKNSILTNNIKDGYSKYLHGENAELFESKDPIFSLKIRPVINLNFNRAFSELQQLKGWGWNLWGEIGENFEFRMDFMENSFTAKQFDITSNYNRTPGRIYSKKDKGSYQFSETNGSMLYHNSFITIGITKEKMRFGSGISGQLVLSEKAPSFPSFYMKISPADWINIYSMHGWLISQVTDTLRSYNTVIGKRDIEFDKYFVMHALQLFPTSDLSITLGETIIYSDRNIYAGYLIPFLFYRSVDHQFTFGSGESGNNGSFFLELNTRPYKNLTAFVSLYIDEFSMANFLKGNDNRNQLGYTLGIKSYPLSDGDLELNVEYTKILPWVYSNWIPTQTYKNAGYILGHYIGQNADQIYLEIIYTPTSKINAKLFGEVIRRGGFINVSNQYSDPGEAFLYGSKMSELNISLEVSYEILYNTYLHGSYKYSNLTDSDLSRSPNWEKGIHHAFAFGITYGY